MTLNIMRRENCFYRTWAGINRCLELQEGIVGMQGAKYSYGRQSPTSISKCYSIDRVHHTVELSRSRGKRVENSYLHTIIIALGLRLEGHKFQANSHPLCVSRISSTSQEQSYEQEMQVLAVGVRVKMNL